MIKKALLIIVLVGILVGSGLSVYMNRLLGQIEITDIDLTVIADGTYVGEHDAKLVYAKVAVTIQDNTIKQIDILEHRHGRGSAGEKIIEHIIDKQSLRVDAISGATGSSKTITKAVEKSLSR